MKRTKKSSMAKEGISAKGFFRIKIMEGGKAVGDSGWKENQIVNNGYQQFLMYAIIASAGSKTATHAALGTGTVPGAADTSLNGELTDAAGCRCALTTGTSGSKTVSFTFTLASNVITAAKTIQNVGLFNGSTTSAGTMFAGNTYATSALATNQAVNGTYQIQFG
ncbi:hypothetical protein EPO05_06660 [Patescibacteria group bacterium]|nr:MAG: hypothetical protein EPO05_06660 [Patescibacteria group bacterium]